MDSSRHFQTEGGRTISRPSTGKELGPRDYGHGSKCVNPTSTHRTQLPPKTILGAIFLLPESAHKSIYYFALITELCKLMPKTAGPAVGKSIRKLYALLADGLDVEVATRFADWFSIHMSNFNFGWVWKEWYGIVSYTSDNIFNAHQWIGYPIYLFRQSTLSGYSCIVLLS